MKLATWNVNSLRVRLPQVLEWAAAVRPDLLCLQETKVPNEAFPAAAFRDAGYHGAACGQAGYNGVAVLSRRPLAVRDAGLPGMADGQRRLLAVNVGGLTVVNVYVPNGQAVGSEKFHYKLRWLEALRDYLAGLLDRSPRLVVTGDFNVAPADEDVYDPVALAGALLCSEAERAAFRALLELGLTDMVRAFPQPPRSFTWWDYRAGAFRRDQGLRIDHILASPGPAPLCRRAWIDRTPRGWPRPSDHAPVVAEFGPGGGDEGL